MPLISRTANQMILPYCPSEFMSTYAQQVVQFGNAPLTVLVKKKNTHQMTLIFVHIVKPMPPTRFICHDRIYICIYYFC